MGPKNNRVSIHTEIPYFAQIMYKPKIKDFIINFSEKKKQQQPFSMLNCPEHPEIILGKDILN